MTPIIESLRTMPFSHINYYPSLSAEFLINYPLLNWHLVHSFANDYHSRRLKYLHEQPIPFPVSGILEFLIYNKIQ